MGKLTKDAYIRAIKEDLKWLDGVTPEDQKNPLEYGHIKQIVEQSIDHYYPDKKTVTQMQEEIERLKEEYSELDSERVEAQDNLKANEEFIGAKASFCIKEYDDKIQSLTKKLELAVEALEKYGNDTLDCDSHHRYHMGSRKQRSCSCGLDQTLQQLKEE